MTRKELLEKALEEARQNGRTNQSALVVNHCSNVTGYVQDMEHDQQVCKRKTTCCLIVDVSQSAGCIPVYADQLEGRCGYFYRSQKSFGNTGHRWALFIREGIELKPLKYGGTGRNSQQLTYEDGDYEYEVGTQNLPGITSTCLPVWNSVRETGVDRIQEKERHDEAFVYEGSGEIPGIQVYGSFKECKGPVMSLNFQGLKSSDAAYILENGYEITVRAGLHCSPLIHEAMGTKNSGTVRVSVSWFTKEEEILAFLEAAGQIAASLRGAD
ncbi:MAG: aminotransferase class V-fold PLP-dependent enzyme [Ruminococcus sp.]